MLLEVVWFRLAKLVGDQELLLFAFSLPPMTYEFMAPVCTLRHFDGLYPFDSGLSVC